MSNYDPTKPELLKFLEPFVERYDAIEYDVEEALYWYAHDYHQGQWSNLYSVLSMSPFKPGAYDTGLVDGSAAEDLYRELCERYSS